jgi:hypothetical protein
VKKVDYYAVPQPWKMPKWLGFTLGGIFAVIAVGSAFLIHDLTKSTAMPVAAAAAAPAAQPEIAPAAQAVAAPAAAAPAPAAEKVASRSSHHKASKHEKRGKHGKAVAVAKRGGLTDAKAHAILAKRDSRSSRKDKDAIDKLLGL